MAFTENVSSGANAITFTTTSGAVIARDRVFVTGDLWLVRQLYELHIRDSKIIADLATSIEVQLSL